MKRYIYSPPSEARQEHRWPKWPIALVLGCTVLGLAAYTSISLAGASSAASESVRSEPSPAVVNADTTPIVAARIADSSAAAVPLFDHCGAIRQTCVVDGDTFWLDGVKIRIADIDTPEVSQPQCASEKALGDRATDRLIQLLNAGPFELHPIGNRDEDRYGRKLRVVVRGGRSLGDQLVAEGLARTWSGRREPWC